MASVSRPTHGSTLFQSLRFRDYRLLWYAGWPWYMARWMDFLALAWFTLELTNSPAWVGVVFFFRLLPLPVLGIPLGVLADRMDRKVMLALVHLMNLATTTLLAIVAITGIVSLPYLMVGAFLLGIGFAADNVVRRALVLDIVGAQHLANANSLDTVVLTGCRVLGPLLAGALIDIGGVGAPFAGLAVCYAVGLLFLPWMGSVAKVRRPRQSMWQSLVQGTGFAMRHRLVLATLLATAVGAGLAMPYGPTIPIFARDILHVGPILMGLLAAADGIGAVAVSIALAGRGYLQRPGLLYMGGIFVFEIGIILFALSRWYPLSFLFLLVAGAGLGAFFAMQFTVILQASPPEMRGRLAGALVMAMGAFPAGNLGLGFVVGALGAPSAVAIWGASGAVLVILLAAWAPAMLRPFPAGANQRDAG